MSASFDPYHKWLGISADEQPASLYRLLGVRTFESDPDVIDTAADQRIRMLKTFQGGQHGPLSQKLLNEVSRARQRLLDPHERAAYDALLRAQAKRQSSNASSSGSDIGRRWPEGKAPGTLSEFFQCLAASGLVTVEEAQRVVGRAPENKRPCDPKSLASELIRAGKLTKYQAVAILQGKLKYLTFGEYLILDTLGQGGMGKVMKAEHRRMKRVVALKLISGDTLKNPDAITRFQREVQASARLIHPNIVTAFDANEYEGMHFYVMEYVEGQDLGAIIKQQGPLAVAQALDCIMQAARGLAYAHGKGIVHRDMKPSNLLLDKEGTVKILDMGLARIDLGEEQHELTNTGQVLGTIDYMAPEQAIDTHTADHRADIYSLGCTLYRLLTGEPLYMGDSIMRKLLLHRDAPLPDLKAKRPEVPARVVAAWQKMVAKLPEHRQQSMAEVVSELELCLQGAPPMAAASAIPSGGGIGMADAKLSEFLSGISARDSGISSPSKSGSGAAVAIKSQKIVIPATSEATQNLKSGETDPIPIAPLRLSPSTSTSSSGSLSNTRLRKSNKSKLLPLWLSCAVAALLTVVGGALAVVAIRRSTKQPAPAPTTANMTQARPPGQDSPGKDAPAAAGSTGSGTSGTATAATSSALPPPVAAAPFSNADAKQHQADWAKYLGQPVEVTNPIGMKLILIPPGRFNMGSTQPQIEAAAAKLPSSSRSLVGSEAPQRLVSVEHPFWLAATEVTVGQFQMFVTATGHRTAAENDGKGAERINPTTKVNEQRADWNWKYKEFSSDPRFPVTCITLADAQAYCDWLGKRYRRRYFLPTEEQWEYACRAGSTGQWYWGDSPTEADKFVWSNSPKPVGEKPANPFGLFDMLGSVAEIALADDGSPVARGGASGGLGPWSFRSASREPRAVASTQVGFRVAMGDDIRNRSNLAPDRRAAEWVVELGGFVVIRGVPGNIATRDKIPPRDFKLTRLSLSNKPRMVTNEDISLLRGLTDLTDLDLGGSVEQVTDKNMSVLAALKNLRVLNLRGSQITDAALQHLRALTDLTVLNLSGTRVTERGVAGLRGLTKLRAIDLSGTKASEAIILTAANWPELGDLQLPDVAYSDAGLAGLANLPGLFFVHVHSRQLRDNQLGVFAGLKKLTSLDLSGSGITDIALPQLHACQGLTFVNLRGTRVTSAGVVELQDALPKCRVDLDSGNLVSKLVAEANRHAAEWVIGQGGTVNVQASGKRRPPMKAAHELPSNFEIEQIALAGRQISDADLPRLTNLAKLKTLDLERTAITDGGLSELHALKALTNLNVKQTKVTAAGIAALQAALPQCKVESDSK